MTAAEISPCEPGELPAAVALLAAQLQEHAIPVRAEALAEGVRRRVADPDGGVVLLAREAGAPVGVAYVSWGWVLECGGVVAWLEELYVTPAHRGRGIGRALLEEVRARALAQGCVAVDLEVEASHERAAGLYRRVGFALLPRTHWTLRLSPSIR